MGTFKEFRDLAPFHAMELNPPTCIAAEGYWLDIFSQGRTVTDGSIIYRQDPTVVLAKPVVMDLTYQREELFTKCLPLQEALPKLPEKFSAQAVLLKNPDDLDKQGQLNKGFDMGLRNGITVIGEDVYLISTSPGSSYGKIKRPWIREKRPALRALAPLSHGT